MDWTTAAEEAFKNGFEKGKRMGMIWHSIATEPFRPEPEHIYMVWRWGEWDDLTRRLKMADLPEIFPGEAEAIRDVVYWCEIKSPVVE